MVQIRRKLRTRGVKRIARTEALQHPATQDALQRLQRMMSGLSKPPEPAAQQPAPVYASMVTPTAAAAPRRDAVPASRSAKEGEVLPPISRSAASASRTASAAEDSRTYKEDRTGYQSVLQEEQRESMRLVQEAQRLAQLAVASVQRRESQMMETGAGARQASPALQQGRTSLNPGN